MRYLIIDDEPHAVELLHQIISEQDSDMEYLGMAHTLNNAIDLINDLQPNLIFLDIMIGGRTGFELLENFPRPNFKTIFTTAHNEFASEAFKHSAVHYLLKPINKNEVKEAINRLRNSESNYSEILNVIKVVQEQAQKKLALPDRMGVEFVLQKRIVYCKGTGSYTDVHFVDGQEKMVSRSIGKIEKVLDPNDFCRVHKKYLININEVSFLEKGKSPVLHMKTGEKVEVSKHYKDNLILMLKEKINFIYDASN